jgi:hypothetical protein
MVEGIELSDIGFELCDISVIETGTDTGTGHEARAPPLTFSEAEASASQGS